MRMIEEQFRMKRPRDRDIKRLDAMLRHLRFMKRNDANFRRQIYMNGEFEKFPAQHTLFRKGDIGDKMYIILKGKVSVQNCMP